MAKSDFGEEVLPRSDFMDTVSGAVSSGTQHQEEMELVGWVLSIRWGFSLSGSVNDHRDYAREIVNIRSFCGTVCFIHGNSRGWGVSWVMHVGIRK